MTNKKLGIVILILNTFCAGMNAVNCVLAIRNPTENIRTPWLWGVAAILWVACAVINYFTYLRSEKH